jgi:hypothetical protein
MISIGSLAPLLTLWGMRCRPCPVLAQNRHTGMSAVCPLSGAKRTSATMQRLLASPAVDYMQSSGGHGLDCPGNVSLPKMGRCSSHKNSFSNVCVGMLVTDADT